MQLWSHGHCGCDAGLAAIVTSKQDHLMASFAPWVWNGWLWEVHHLKELGFFQCKKVNIPLVYKGRVIRVLSVYFLYGISRERPRVTAQMEVPPWLKGGDRNPSHALLYSFPFYHSTPSFPPHFKRVWYKQRDGIDLWGCPQKSWSKVVTVGKVSSPGLSLALANCPVPKAMGKEPSGSH